MPVGPHLAHCLAQYGAHFHVDLLFNLGIIWGVIIMRFHCKYCCFCTLYRARYVKKKLKRGFHYGARYVKKKLELHLHYGDKQSQFKMVRWPEASGLLAGWLAAASCCLACCWLAGCLAAEGRWLAEGFAVANRCCWDSPKAGPVRNESNISLKLIRLRIKEPPTKTNELHLNL